MSREEFIDCGGPPQTARSGRRQQEDHADAIRCVVEFAFQLIERALLNVAQWRLLLRCALRTEEYKGSQRDDSEENGGEYGISSAMQRKLS